MRTLLVTALAAAALGAAAQPAQGAKFMLSVMQDDNQLVYGSAQARETALRRMKVLGVDAIRVTVLWEAIAGRRKPSSGRNPSSYPASRWDRYDDLVRAAQRYGLAVYFNVTPPGPRWAHARANDPANQRTWRPNVVEFGRFFQAVARRYNGEWKDENSGRAALPRVGWWGIGNEPNQGGWLMPQAREIGGRIVPQSPHWYRKLLVAGADALLRTGHGDDLILIGETAPLGVRPQSERRPLRPALFIRELFCLQPSLRRWRGRAARARGCGDMGRLAATLQRLPKLAFAHHPYTKDLPPTQRDRSRDAITVANLKSLPTLLDRVAARTGAIPQGLPILLTEFGYETDPPDPHNGVKEEKQAQYLNEGDYAAYRSERVFANTQFQLFDVPPRREFPRNSQAYWFTYQSGLFTALPQSRPKPAAFAYRLPFVVKRSSGGGYLFWGQVRFTPNGANQQVFLQQRAANGSWQTVGGAVPVTNGMGFFEVTRPAQKGQRWRAAWAAADFSAFAISREIVLP
jgi:Cellulase (glycosyl hydrolase family 5)